MLSRFLLSKLLDRQGHGVQDAGQIDVEHAEVGHGEARLGRVVDEPGPFSNAGDRVDVVDTPKIGDSLAEGLGL